LYSWRCGSDDLTFAQISSYSGAKFAPSTRQRSMRLNRVKLALQPSTQLGSRAAGEAWRTSQAHSSSIVNGLFRSAWLELDLGSLMYANYSVVAPPQIPALRLSIICGPIRAILHPALGISGPFVEPHTSAWQP
jgi:hypothetical protein